MRPTLRDYAEVAGQEVIGELRNIAAHLKDLRLQIINATPVSEALARMIPLLRELGIETRWDVIKSGEAFGEVARTLSRGSAEITDPMMAVYRETMEQNRREIPITGDVVLVCGLESAGFIGDNQASWLWRRQTGLAEQHPQVRAFLQPYIEQYDAAIVAAPEFAPPAGVPAYVIAPAIDPLNDRNRELTGAEIAGVLERYHLDARRPILAHVLRSGIREVIAAYRIVKRRRDCQLLLVREAEEGGFVREFNDPDIHVAQLPPFGGLDLNALVRASTLVFHHSRGGCADGAVSETLWKGVPVIAHTGGAVRRQIIDGVTGYLAHSPEGAAIHALELLNSPSRAREMGEAGREQVRRQSLLPHEIKDYLLAMLAVAYPNGDMVTSQTDTREKTQSELP